MIIQGDCLEVLKTLEDESIDMCLTSPPYDNLRTYGGDWTIDIENIVKQLYRVLKIGGVCVWVVADSVIDGSESGSSFRQAISFMDNGFRLHDTMIYEKNGAPFPDKTRYSQVWEYMFVFSKGKPKTINLIKDRKNRWAGSSNFGKPSKRLKNGELKQNEPYVVAEYGTRFNIWKYNTGKGFSTKDKIAFQHPAIFPDELAKDHILSWTNEGDIVMDIMAGSGTTLKQAKLLNRKYLGIEINPDYIKIINDRL
jgi:site-specific DNA-methyltransferase (adenine-specific)